MNVNLNLTKLRLVILRRNFNKMPSPLRFLTVHALISSVFFIFSVIPVVPVSFFGISSRRVSYAEWWSSGLGISASIIGIILPISGYMLLSRNKYARVTYISSIVFACILYPLLIFGLQGESIISLILVLVAILGILSAYLYLNKSVKSYFTSRDEVS